MKATESPVYVPQPTAEVDAAITAFAVGAATEAQQRLAFDWILVKLCGVKGVTYRPAQSDAAFLEGRRFVGLFLASMVSGKIQLRETTHDRPSKRG